MYSLPFFGAAGGGQTLPITSLYDYLDTLNIPEVVPTLYEYLDTLTGDTTTLPSVFEYLNNFTSIAIAPETISQSIISATNVEFVYTVTRVNPRNITTTVNYTVSSGSTYPASASDFVGDVFPSGSLVFLPEETTKTVTVTLKAKSQDFLGKNFILSVTAEDSDGGLVLDPNPVTGRGEGELTSILNASLWLDAADASTLTVTNNAVSEWRDKTGNNRHPSQGTASIQPLFVASDTSISFAGGKSFNIPGLSTATGNQNLFIVHSYAGATSLIFWNASNAVIASYVMQSNTTSAVSDGFGTPTYYREDNLQTWTTRTAVRNALLNRTSIVGAMGCVLSGFNRIGGYASFNFVDKIYEIIAIPGTISPENRNKVTGYLAWKWGLVASLPANHPYKNTAPS